MKREKTIRELEIKFLHAVIKEHGNCYRATDSNLKIIKERRNEKDMCAVCPILRIHKRDFCGDNVVVKDAKAMLKKIELLKELQKL